MRIAVALLFLMFSSIAVAGGDRKVSPAAASTSDRAAPDPCQLLTVTDIQRAQGERFSGTRQTEKEAGGFRLLECFYSTPTPTRSVSLAVAVSDASKKVASGGPRGFWKERFHAANEKESDEARADGEKEETRPPLAVSGVGEEAYWMGNRLAGALYVLSGERFLRISLGGAESDEIKRRKSVVLAKAVLARFQRVFD